MNPIGAGLRPAPTWRSLLQIFLTNRALVEIVGGFAGVSYQGVEQNQWLGSRRRVVV